MKSPLIEVKQSAPTEEQKRLKKTSNEWGLYVNSILIGVSKNQVDADHAKVMLEKALCEAK